MPDLSLPKQRARLEEFSQHTKYGGETLRWIVKLAFERQEQLEREALGLNGAWRCSCCGELMEAPDSRWRWNGKAWEHSHGQAGHFEARNFTDGK